MTTYVWLVDAILKNGQKLEGVYECELSDSEKVFRDMVYDADMFPREYIAFCNYRDKQAIYIPHDELAALIITAPSLNT